MYNRPSTPPKVEEGTEVGDVLDQAFQYLTAFQAGDDRLALFGQIALDEGLVRDNGILDGFVDLHHLEFHRLTYVAIVIDDRLDVDLRTRQEGFQTATVGDQTTFGLADHGTRDHRTVLVAVLDHFPGAQQLGFAAGKNQLATLIFLTLYVNVNRIAHLQVRHIAEFRQGEPGRPT